MKNLLKKSAYKLTSLLVVLTIFQTAVMAEDGKTAVASNSLSGVQVVGAVALLVAFIVVPVFKRSRRIATK
jgi:hypothetical protein